MKFELKSENENISRTFSNVFKTVSFLAVVVFFFDVSLKLGIISRKYQIEYNCKLLSVEKSKHIFEKLSRISNLKSKQRIREFCIQVIK